MQKKVRRPRKAKGNDVIAFLDPDSLTPRARLLRAAENRGFNLIQIFFRRINLNGKWIHFSEKKIGG